MCYQYAKLKAREGGNPTEPLEREPGRLGADGVVPIAESVHIGYDKHSQGFVGGNVVASASIEMQEKRSWMKEPTKASLQELPSIEMQADVEARAATARLELLKDIKRRAHAEPQTESAAAEASISL